MNKSAIVVGGSLGGLTAANLLRNSGWDVKVYEKASDGLDSRGAGLVTYPELFDILGKAGVSLRDEGLGINVERRVAWDKQGKIIDQLNYPQIVTSWNKLFRVLRDAFPDDSYFSGHAAVDFSADGMKAKVLFDNGLAESCDLIVAADGYKSLFRTRLFPHVQRNYAGYVAWRGMVPESAMVGRLRPLFDDFNFAIFKGGQIVAYPVAGEDNSLEPGRRRFNFVWYRPATQQELTNISTDASGRVWDDGIPPPLIRAEVIERIKAAAHQELPEQLAEVVQIAPNVFFQPISDLSTDAMVSTNIALVGDAAFMARPHCGMGVTKAAQDAYQLVTSISQHESMSAALSDYERRRVAFGKRVVQKAQWLGAYMQATKVTDEEFAMARYYAEPRNVLADTATPLSSEYA